uniref:NADH-ubiquinone oxidoreductase chain 3 n=1 Tax=Conwentzia sinica TaxID=450904 RepID=A0A7U1AQB0_9NEOP|nr:NADH dehydrogenase subunit 3 [Conwentzia sinica]QQY84954.1 NADH dehydrogenase subunit 3 [Conwentzia sinica]
MYLLILINFILLMISIFVMMLASLLSKKMNFDSEKNSPFECGFDPKTSSRLPFSLCFFLIAIIFLIFDIEIALLLPMVNIMKMSNLISFISTLMFFILILILGLYYEWNQGSLNWSN